ncbi:YgaP family membrane protein [Frigidibacter sp. MR17.24]|uniref:YgaP family membrane protein n=1 Tax=Frigidibacter sp. MR17.24 TaxID=3127345 RepID=UPI003012FB3B
MGCNVGGIDRALRIVLGAGLLALALGGMLPAGTVGVVAGIIGLVLLATGLFRFCPAYLPFGLRTCRK